MLRFISSSRNSDLLATVASLSAASWLIRNETAIFLSVLGLPDPSRGPPRCRCTLSCSLFIMEC